MNNFTHTHPKARWLRPIFQVIVSIMAVWMLIPCSPDCRADEHDLSEESIDFTTFSLEDLKNVEIISVSKKPEKLAHAAAAVFVITQEDIRRSGVTNIPDALRLAPGLQVARDEATDWEITVRGLNEDFSNNLLVLVDGRSVYSPVFSGVLWDIQDTLLEDIERIEVIRGPGATVWGANAVNGVINIITKSAKDTQGTQIIALGGTEEGSVSLRYGGTIGENIFYRTYAKCFNREHVGGSKEGDDDPDAQSGDNWRSIRGGFRIDRERTPGNSLTLEGEVYSNGYDAEYYQISLSPPYKTEKNDTSKASGGHLLGRWQSTISDTSDATVQFYYNRDQKDYNPGSGSVDTIDLDFRSRFSGFSQHDVVWGLGYRFITDDFEMAENDRLQMSLEPHQLDQHLWSAFVQNEIQLIPDRLSLIIGSKFEHNDYTGLEVQPSIRFLWTPGERHVLWGAISRAVRTPSRIERNVKQISGLIPPGHPRNDSELPIAISTIGSEDLDSEKLTAYEVGYRLDLTNTLWLDMTAFYSDYDKLITVNGGEGYPEAEPSLHYAIPLYAQNDMKGEAYGAEVAADWQMPWKSRLRGTYSFLETKQLRRTPFVGLLEGVVSENQSNPRHQFSLRYSVDIMKDLELDLWLRYVDHLSGNDVGSYTTLDARLAWEPSKNMELSLVGQNLPEKEHEEFSDFEIERSVYLKCAWRF